MHRLVIALVAILGLTAGGYVAGYLLLASASVDRAAALAPADAGYYVSLNLQPSTSQRGRLAGLIGRLPGFADAAALDEKVDQVVSNLLASAGIDYLADVKPWLGDQLAVTGWPDGTDAQRAVVIAMVADRAAAEEALPRLISDGGATPTVESYRGSDLHVGDRGAYAFIGEAVVASGSADAVRAVIDVAAGGASLGERADFRDAMVGLPQDNLASAFVDLRAVWSTEGAGSDPLSVASVALVAEAGGLRLTGSIPIDDRAASPQLLEKLALGAASSSLAGWMPGSTVAGFVTFGLAGTLTDLDGLLARVDPSGEALGVVDAIRGLAAFGFGIDLDAELLPLLDREVGLALTGLAGDLPRGVVLLRPSDAPAAAATLDRLASRLVAMGGTRASQVRDGIELESVGIPEAASVTYAVDDGVVIIGLEVADVVESVSAHRSGDALGLTDAYRRAFEVAGMRAGDEAFVDIGRAVEEFGLGGALDSLPDDARDILLHLGAFGLTMPSGDDHIDFHAVVTVDDRGAE